MISPRSDAINEILSFEENALSYSSRMAICVYIMYMHKVLDELVPSEIMLTYKTDRITTHQSPPANVLEKLCIRFSRRNKQRSFNDYELAELKMYGHPRLAEHINAWWQERINLNKVDKLTKQVTKILKKRKNRPHHKFTKLEKKLIRNYFPKEVLDLGIDSIIEYL